MILRDSRLGCLVRIGRMPIPLGQSYPDLRTPEFSSPSQLCQ